MTIKPEKVSSLTPDAQTLYRCDFNMYNIRYAEALSKQRGVKRAAEEDKEEEEEEDEELSEEMSEASLDESELML